MGGTEPPFLSAHAGSCPRPARGGADGSGVEKGPGARNRQSTGRSRQRDAGNKPGRVRGPRPLPRVPRGPGSTPAGVSGFAQHRVGKEKQGESRGSCWEGWTRALEKLDPPFAPVPQFPCAPGRRFWGWGMLEEVRGGDTGRFGGVLRGVEERGAPHHPLHPGFVRGRPPTRHRPLRVPTATHAGLSVCVCVSLSLVTCHPRPCVPPKKSTQTPSSFLCTPKPLSPPPSPAKVTALGDKVPPPPLCPIPGGAGILVPAGWCHRVPLSPTPPVPLEPS